MTREHADPRSPAAWRSLLFTIREVAPERLSETVAQARQALPSDSHEAWLVIAEGHRDAGEPQDSIRAYRSVLRLPGSDELEFSREEAREAIEELENAIAELPRLRQEVETSPRDYVAWDTYLDALASLDRDELAGAIERARQRLDPRDRHTWTTLGFAYQELYDYPRTIECLQRAIELAGEDESTDALQMGIEQVRGRIARRDGATHRSTAR